MPMITAATWVPRGAASRHPEHYVFDDAEYSRVSKLAQLELDNARERLASATERSNGTNGNDHAGSDNM